MKKIILLLVLGIFVGAGGVYVINQITERNSLEVVDLANEKELEIPDKVVGENSDAPYCGGFYDLEKSPEHELNIDDVLATFSHAPENFRKFGGERLGELFRNDEFLALIANADAISFCTYWNHFVVSVYKNDISKGVNTIGVYARDFDQEGMGYKFITSEQDFRPQGDLYTCGIVGFAGNELIYNCSAGDGCGGMSKIYAVDLSSEETKTLVDCDYGCMASEDWDVSGVDRICRVDIFN